MLTVVSDSDVIIHLTRLNEMRLLSILYKTVHIPRYVEYEMINNQYDEAEKIKDVIRKGILKVHETDDKRVKDIVKEYNIHIGEGHVKGLAEKLNARIFLSNERKVRLVAKKEGFHVVGSIGIVLRSVVENILSMKEAVVLLERLKDKEFRIHPNVIDSAIDSLGRNKGRFT